LPALRPVPRPGRGRTDRLAAADPRPQPDRAGAPLPRRRGPPGGAGAVARRDARAVLAPARRPARPGGRLSQRVGPAPRDGGGAGRRPGGAEPRAPGGHGVAQPGGRGLGGRAPAHGRDRRRRPPALDARPEEAPAADRGPVMNDVPETPSAREALLTEVL